MAQRGGMMAGRTIALVAAPAPLQELEPPLPPELPIAKGFPIAPVAIALGAVVLIAGGIIFSVWKAGPQISVEPRLDLEGREIAHVKCKSCTDGTSVEIASSKGVLKDGAADVSLTTPLQVGTNELSVELTSPAAGARKETVKVALPVLYRVRTDLANIASFQPTVSVIVQAVPGSKIEVDGKPVALDDKGVASAAVPWKMQQAGEADESKLEVQTIGYSVTPPGKAPEKSEVAVRSMVSPLRVDSPVPGVVTTQSQVRVSGRTAGADSHVRINGADVPLNERGAYATDLPLPHAGELPLEIVTYGPALAPRTVKQSVFRVDSLEREAAKREHEPSLGYDAVALDVAAHVKEAMVVEGEVVDARRQGYRIIALVDDRRGCAHGPCITRVITSESDGVAKGESIRAFGHVSRPFTSASGVVPEVEAELTLKVAPAHGGDARGRR